MSTSKKQSFSQLINAGEQPVLVDFYATWCGPCQTLGPIVQDIAQTFKDRVKVIKIDVDKNQALANQYKVRGVPTLILFWKGQVLWQQAGLMTKRDLAAKINGALNRSYA
ncbi:MAG: thioredoxin [Tunicatimonas sp.]